MKRVADQSTAFAYRIDALSTHSRTPPGGWARTLRRYLHIYIYMCVCVCVCVYVRMYISTASRCLVDSLAHTGWRLGKDSEEVFAYICVCVCVCVPDWSNLIVRCQSGFIVRTPGSSLFRALKSVCMQFKSLRDDESTKKLLAILCEGRHLIVLVHPFDPTAPSVPDGIRLESNAQESARFTQTAKDLLIELGLPFVEVGPGTVDERVREFCLAVTTWVGCPK
jgi:hypothetical protein